MNKKVLAFLGTFRYNESYLIEKALTPNGEKNEKINDCFDVNCNRWRG